MNGVIIDKVSKLFEPIPSETTHAIQVNHPFDVTNQIIIPLSLTEVPSYFEVKSILQKSMKIQISLRGDPSSPYFSQMECFFAAAIQASEQ